MERSRRFLPFSTEQSWHSNKTSWGTYPKHAFALLSSIKTILRKKYNLPIISKKQQVANCPFTECCMTCYDICIGVATWYRISQLPCLCGRINIVKPTIAYPENHFWIWVGWKSWSTWQIYKSVPVIEEKHPSSMFLVLGWGSNGKTALRRRAPWSQSTCPSIPKPRQILNLIFHAQTASVSRHLP